jgi:DNA-binding SARP family transcriptional activator/TolB-like protein
MLRVRTLGGLSVEGSSRSGAATQPRRLAVLALIARHDRGVTRERVLSLLWPDMDDESGRRALTQSLYALRKDLGAADLFVGVQELRLNAEVAASDAHEFEAAVRAGDLERAAGLYAGRFLAGFRVGGAPEFERWADEQATELAHTHASVLQRLAHAATADGRTGDAVTWWRKLAALDPLNARVAVALMDALVAIDASAEALRHAGIYTALLEAELDLPPDRAVTELAEQIRVDAARRVDSAQVAPQPRSEAAVTATAGALERPFDTPQPAAAPAAASVRRRRLPRAALFAVPVVLAALFAVLPLPRGADPSPASATAADAVVLAVGRISDYTGADAASALSDMLATNLARSEDLRVISTPRLYALLQRGDAHEDFGAAATQAGANTLLEGSVFATAGGLRLDLRRIDLTSGAVLAAYVVEGSDLFALADGGTAQLVADLGAARLSSTLTDVTTTSLAAYRHYVDGLRHYYRGDRHVAGDRFEQALAQDSTFAVAAFYHALAPALPSDETVRRLNRAVRLADRATDRERLTIRAAHARLTASPTLGAIADTLAVRYPHSVEGHFYRAIFLGMRQGERAPAIEAFRRVLDMEGSDADVAFIECAACHVYNELVAIHLHADSFAAAVRVGDEGRRRYPDHPTVWRASARALAHAGRYDEAVAAFATSARLAATDNLPENEAWVRLLAEEYHRADALLREQLRLAPTETAQRARTLLVLSLRAQGRLNEALVQARAILQPGRRSRGAAVAPAATLEAWLLADLGRPDAAAALLDSIARWSVPGDDPSAAAGNRITALTHRASLAAQFGDTARLVQLADEVRQLIPLDGERQRRDFDRYIVGLLWAARGDDASAERALREALFSPALGYSRINTALAEVHLRSGRPLDAVAVLQPVVRGGVSAWSAHVSRTDARALLGRAWEEAGSPDSALHHYDRAIDAWRNADPPVAARRDELARRSAGLRNR